MSECILTQNFDLDCADSIAGISEFYVIENSSLGAVTEASGVVTGIATLDSKKFQRYRLRDEVGSLQFPVNHNQQNGSTFYEHTLVFKMDQLVVAKRNELQIMDRVNVTIIAKDENGRYWMAGKTKGMYPSAGNGGTGTAKGDHSGFERTYIAREKEMPVEVTAGLIVAGLINGL